MQIELEGFNCGNWLDIICHGGGGEKRRRNREKNKEEVVFN